MYQLYSYFRSSAVFRVRIALHLKHLPHDIIPIHLLKDGGQQKNVRYLDKNPQGLLPLLDDLNTHHQYIQSLSIIEYLDEKHPDPPLLPSSIDEKAYVRAISHMVACDIHPLNNLRVLQHLKQNFQITDEQKNDWCMHWIHEGFTSIERWLSMQNLAKNCCHQNQPTLADLCLIPQVYNALRFKCNMNQYPTIKRIYEHCMSLPAFEKAAPENQPDFE